MAAAAVAFFAPRPFVAVGGVLLSTASYAFAILGEQTTFAAAIMVLALGAASAKATLLCAAAESMTTARARLVVVVIGYAMWNVAGVLGPFVGLGDPRPGSPLGPLVAAALLTVMSLSGAAIGHMSRPANAQTPSSEGGLAVLAVVLLPQGFLWLMVESQPTDLGLPVWSSLLNPSLIVLLTLPIGLGFGLAPSRWLPWLATVLVAAGVLAIGAGFAGLATRDPGVWVGVNALLTFAECGVSMLALALMVSLSSARAAPFALALNSVLTARLSNLAMLPEQPRRSAMLVLGVLSVVAIVVLFVLRRPLLDPLAAPIEPAAG
ncbi:MAG: hypothetical protein JNJ54_05760 [Myxococcaceae bacterium]|nr:hypothetical protein [Myxococcaceae bacterium]